MKLTGESKVLLGILGVTVAIIAVAAVVMTKPAPTLSKNDLILPSSHGRGNPQARTYLVEFSDFQCPACLAAKPTIDAVLKKHATDVFFVYRHFPLDQHPFSHKAANAAEAAANQGKFWEMYDALFANQEKFSDNEFPELAKQLNLDLKKFGEDTASPKTADIVAKDQQAGTTLGVNSTPSFFLNGRKLELTTFDDLTRAVDDAVTSAK
jgi:protein-disulfide isomerase